MKHSTSTIRIAALLMPLLLLLGGCGKDEPTTQSGEDLITDIATISNTADRRTLVGKKVDIASAKVQSVVGNYVFWAGEPHTAVPIAREDKMHGTVPEHVRSGDSVRIKGTIRLLENLPDTDPLWDSISNDERRDILAARVYVAAESVAILP